MSAALAAVDAAKARERAGWGERAASYGLLTGRITARVAETLIDAAGIGAGSRVLDVGSGPGYAAAEAAGRGAQVTAVDISEEMVALAQARHAGVRFLCADAEELPFPDSSFDVVTGNLVINHLPRPERAVRELARVARPGGRVALSAWDVPERTRFLGILIDALHECDVAEAHDASRFRFADEDEFRALLGAGGLEDVEVRAVSLVHRVVDVDELWRGMIGGSARAGALVMRQPPSVRARIQASVERLAGEYRAGDGFVIPSRAKIASGSRP